MGGPWYAVVLTVVFPIVRHACPPLTTASVVLVPAAIEPMRTFSTYPCGNVSSPAWQRSRNLTCDSGLTTVTIGAAWPVWPDLQPASAAVIVFPYEYTNTSVLSELVDARCIAASPASLESLSPTDTCSLLVSLHSPRFLFGPSDLPAAAWEDAVQLRARPGNASEPVAALVAGEDVGVLVFRRDLLLAANFTAPPATWPQLIAIAQTVRGKGACLCGRCRLRPRVKSGVSEQCACGPVRPLAIPASPCFSL